MTKILDSDGRVKDAATETTLQKRFGGGKDPFVTVVTASGDTTLITPGLGNYLIVYYIQAGPKPTSSTWPRLKFTLGTTDLHQGYAIAHWEEHVGGVNQALKINCSEAPDAAGIAVTVHYLEVTP